MANGKWLDLACGQGALLELARSFGFETILGVDDSEEMVAICQAANLPVQQSEAVDFLTRSCPECWHVVSAFDLLEHLTRDEGFSLLCEVWRALSPGGVCLLKLPNGDSPWSVSVMSSDLTHETLYSPESLEQLSKLAGFARCDLREVGPICTGLLSTVRQVLWIGAKAVYRGLSLVETGSAGRGINTRNMLARLSK